MGVILSIKLYMDYENITKPSIWTKVSYGPNQSIHVKVMFFFENTYGKGLRHSEAVLIVVVKFEDFRENSTFLTLLLPIQR